MKPTDWYQGWQKPLPDRPGEFDRKWPFGNIERHWWDGMEWTPLKAMTPYYFPQDLPWRGLSAPQGE